MLSAVTAHDTHLSLPLPVLTVQGPGRPGLIQHTPLEELALTSANSALRLNVFLAVSLSLCNTLRQPEPQQH